MKQTFSLSIIFALVFVLFYSCFGQTKIKQSAVSPESAIKTGAEQTEKYIPQLKGKRIVVVANRTSVIGKILLVDRLKTLGENVVKIFDPEHGFQKITH